MVRPSNIITKMLTKNNFMYTIPCKLFQFLNVRRVIHLAGSERGGVLKISELFFFRGIWFY